MSILNINFRKMKKKVYTFQIEEELYERIKQKCFDKGEKIAYIGPYINHLLALALTEEERREKELYEKGELE